MAIQDDTADLLERLSIFSTLSAAEITELAKVAVPRSYEPGQVVFREGDPGDTCFVIRSGAVKMLEAMADRIRATNERLANQSFQTVAGRVAGVLIDLVDARQAEGAGTSDVLVEATQADIAQLAGASRESASRFLATLERQGVVTTQRGKVVVHDPGSLRNYIY